MGADPKAWMLRSPHLTNQSKIHLEPEGLQPRGSAQREHHPKMPLLSAKMGGINKDDKRQARGL